MKNWRNALSTFFSFLLLGILSLLYLLLVYRSFEYVILKEKAYLLMDFIGLLVIVAPIIIMPIVYYSTKKDQKVEEIYWKELAKLYHLQLNFNTKKQVSTIVGIVDNRKIIIDKKKLPSVQDKKKILLHTRLRISLKKQPKSTFYLRREDKADKLLKKLGRGKKDLLIGVHRFDSQYVIYSDDVNFAKSILTKEIQQELQIVQRRFKGKLHIQHKEITYQYEGLLSKEKDMEHFHSMIPILMKIANVIGQIKK